ncbi:MAG: hypothetical protein ACT4TC_08250 [Myxococcaceae bacterium]
MRKVFEAAVAACLLAACGAGSTGAPTMDLLEEDLSELTGNVKEGTAEATGVLKLANVASRETLQNAVLLSAQASTNIIAYRLGDDGTAGTADDQSFDTLAELDAVPFMSSPEFNQLLAYAKANGYVPGQPPGSDVFSSDWCTGTPMTRDEAVARFSAGSTGFYLGRYSVIQRNRTCTELTGCAGWGSGGSSQLLARYLPNGTYVGIEGRKVSVPEGALRLVVENDSTVRIELQPDGEYKETQFRAPIDGAQKSLGSISLTILQVGTSKWNQPAAVITNRCLRVGLGGESEHTPAFTETELVLFATY